MNKKPLNLPFTIEEQIMKMAELSIVNRNWLEAEARKAGVDFDDKYDESFGRHEIGVERENLEALEQNNEL